MTDLILYPDDQKRTVCVWCGLVQQGGGLPTKRIVCPTCKPEYLSAQQDEELPFFVNEAVTERDRVEELREAGYQWSVIPQALRDKDR